MADNNKILLVVIIIAAVLGYLYFSGYFQQGGMYGGAPGIAPYTGGGYSGGAPQTTAKKDTGGLPIDTILYAILALILILALMKLLPDLIRRLGGRRGPPQPPPHGPYGGPYGGGDATETLTVTPYLISGNKREPLATSEKKIESEYLRNKLKTDNKLVATAKKGDEIEIDIALTDATGNPLREEYTIKLKDQTKKKDLREKDLANVGGKWVYKTTSGGSDMYKITATHKGKEHQRLLHITSEKTTEEETKLNLVITPFRIAENGREQLTTKEEQVGSEHLKKTLKLEKKSVATTKEGDKLEIEISLSDSKGNILKEDYKITVKSRNKTEKLGPDKEGHAIYKTDALNRLYQISATHQGKEYRTLLHMKTEPAASKTADTTGKYEIRAENTICEAGKSCKFYVQVLDAKKKGIVKIKKITFQPIEGSKNIRAEKIEFKGNDSGQRAENELRKVQEGANKIKIKATLENDETIEGEVTITGTKEPAQKKKGNGLTLGLFKDPMQKAEERATKAAAGITTAENAEIELKKEKATLAEARKALEGAKSAKESKDNNNRAGYLKDAEAKLASVEAELKKLEQQIEITPLQEYTHYKGRYYVRAGAAPTYMVSLRSGEDQYVFPPTSVKAYEGNKELAKTDKGSLTTPAQKKGRKEYTFEVEGIGKKKIEVEWLTLKDAVAKGITRLKFTIKESSNKKLSEYAGKKGAHATLIAEASGTEALREMEYLYMLRIKEGDSVKSASMKDPAEHHTSIDGTKKYTAELIDAEEGGSKTDHKVLKETIENIRKGATGGVVCSSKTITVREESSKGANAPTHDTSGKYEIRAENTACEAGKDCKFDVEVREAQTKKGAKVKKITFTPAEGSKKIRHKTIPSGLDALRGAYEGLIENELCDVQEGPNRIEITATLTDGTLVAGEMRITGTKAKEAEKAGGGLTLETEDGKENPDGLVTTADETKIWIKLYKNGRLHDEEKEVKVWATSGFLDSLLGPSKKTIKVKQLHLFNYKTPEGNSTLHVQLGKQERSIKITRTKSEEKKKEDANKVKEKSTDKQKKEESGITFDLELEGTEDRKASTITTSADEIYVKITVKKDGKPYEQSRDRPPIKAKAWVKTSRFSLKTNGQEFELNRDEPTHYKQVLKNKGRYELFFQIGKQVKSIKITRT